MGDEVPTCGRAAVAPRRTLVGLLALAAVLIALVLTGCASASAPAHRSLANVAPASTRVHTVHAYNSDGTLAVHVGNVATGSCFTQSIADPVAGAYRCFAAGNQLLDPCFAPPAAARAPTSLACLPEPWSAATVLTLTKRLPAGSVDLPPRPWGLELANGARCVAATGTVRAVAGVNLVYSCRRDAGAAALVDPAVRPGRTLSAHYAAPGATGLRTVAVTGVWRG